MKSSALLAPLCLVLMAGLATAQPKAQDHSAHGAAGAPTASNADQNATPLSDGEVRRVDKETGKLTLKHGEIKNLDMPPMTMVFQVKEPALLDKVKAGDKVKFRAEKAPSGYVVTAVEVVK